MSAPRSTSALFAIVALVPLALSWSARSSRPGGPQEKGGAAPQGKGEALDFKSMRDKENARIAAEIQGAWELVRFDDPQLTIAPGDVKGYALIESGYLSLTLQARRKEGSLFGGQYDFPFQATVQQYRLEADGKLVTSNLIGLGDFGGLVDAEPPGTPHSFEVMVGAMGLELTRGDRGKLVFRRLEANAPFPKKAEELIDRGALKR